MLPHEAFLVVIEKHNLRQQKLASLFGVDKGVVSRFVNEVSDIKTCNLQKLLKVLPPQAKAHYYMLFSYDELTKDNIKVAEKDNTYKV